MIGVIIVLLQQLLGLFMKVKIILNISESYKKSQNMSTDGCIIEICCIFAAVSQIKTTTIMKKNVILMALAVGLIMTSCASKKDLANCQSENKSLTESLQAAKEDLAAKNARISALEEQQRGM